MRPRRAREPTARYTVPRRVMVDSSVLIDVLDPDPVWFEWSAKHLAPLVDEGALVINPIIYAELAAGYTTLEALDAAIAPYALVRDALPWEAAFLASLAFLLYRKRRGAKQSPLPDFYIGAHASLAGYALLTRDARRYREYFPKLRLISPA